MEKLLILFNPQKMGELKRNLKPSKTQMFDIDQNIENVTVASLLKSSKII